VGSSFDHLAWTICSSFKLDRADSEFTTLFFSDNGNLQIDSKASAQQCGIVPTRKHEADWSLWWKPETFSSKGEAVMMF
jgi:hypothetical protein